MSAGLNDVAQRARSSRSLRGAARAGLAGRGVLYLVLAVLAGQLALRRGTAPVNGNGAMTRIAGAPLGRALLFCAAAGFLAFAVTRAAGAFADRRAGRLRRLSTAGQALLYVLLALTTLSFVFGADASGSEQQQDMLTQRVLDWPAGRVLVGAVGAGLVAVCTWQLVVAARSHFADTLDTDEMPRLLRPVAAVVGRVGIAARALTAIPIGAFLVLAAVRIDAETSTGLDALLADLSKYGWGRATVLAVAAGFAVFAAYSFLEARYRQVASGH